MERFTPRVIAIVLPCCRVDAPPVLILAFAVELAPATSSDKATGGLQESKRNIEATEIACFVYVDLVLGSVTDSFVLHLLFVFVMCCFVYVDVVLGSSVTDSFMLHLLFAFVMCPFFIV